MLVSFHWLLFAVHAMGLTSSDFVLDWLRFRFGLTSFYLIIHNCSQLIFELSVSIYVSDPHWAMSRAVVWLCNDKHWAYRAIYCSGSHHRSDGAPSSSFEFIRLIDWNCLEVGRQQGLGQRHLQAHNYTPYTTARLMGYAPLSPMKTITCINRFFND